MATLSTDLEKARAERRALSQGEALRLAEQAEQALELVETAEQAEDLLRQITTVEQAARRWRAAHAAVVGLSRVRLRTEDRWGELLGEPEHGGDRRSDQVSAGNLIGADRKAVHLARKVHALPEEAKTAYLDVEDPPEPFTRAGLLSFAKDLERERRRTEAAVQRTDPAPPREALAGETFQVLLADPPWRYEGAPAGDPNRDLANQYPTMTLPELRSLDVPAAEDAVLFCWATLPKLAEALELIDAWGFRYRTGQVWVKDRIGMGYYYRQRAELLLVGTRGQPGAPDPEDRPDGVLEAPRGGHSVKPEQVYEQIEAMYPDASRVELFARTAREDWTGWGNEL